MKHRNHTPSHRTLARLLLSVCAFAVTSSVASASFAQGRGPMAVLGLRAPDGDDEAAANATNALRRAVRAAGYEVPNDSPALEQSMAAFGCDESVPPECLTQIAGDLHGQRFVWGAVRRHGHGHDAPLTISVSLFDNATHQNVGHGEAEVARALAQDSDSLVPTARHLVEQMVPAQAATGPASPPPGGGNQHAGRGGQGEGNGPPGNTTPSPIRRYVGFAGAVVGGALVVTGGVLAIYWLTLSSNSDWTTYMPMSTSGGDVCTAANNNSGLDPAAMRAASVCNTGNSVSLVGWTTGIIGAVLLVGGVALVMTDHSRETPPGAQSLRAHRRAWSFAPIVAPGYSGAALGVQF